MIKIYNMIIKMKKAKIINNKLKIKMQTTFSKIRIYIKTNK